MGRFITTVALGAGLILATAAATPALAQEESGEPETRVVTVTSFQVPFGDRSEVWPFLRDRILPTYQLHPKVLNFRVLTHYWGGNASDISLVAEYARFADLDEPCGKPCDDYFEANPAPEEGEEGYEEFAKSRDKFNKYYADHRDEIYNTAMDRARIEGGESMKVGAGGS